MRSIVQAGRVAGIIVFALAGGGVVAPASSQGVGGRAAPRIVGGADFIFARPTGQFLENVKQGFGGGLHVIFPASNGVIGLRLDGAFIRYGHRSQDVLITAGFQQFVTNENTDNNIMMFGIGPQLMMPSGPIRPYVNAHGGFSRFYTQTSFDDLDPQYFETTHTESSDWQLEYGGGAGFYIPIAAGVFPMSIDIGAQYHVNGRATYLVKGDVHEDPNTGQVTLTPRQSEVRFVTYRLGLTVAF